MTKRLRTLKTRYLKDGTYSLYYRGKRMAHCRDAESAENFKVGWYEAQGHTYWPFGRKPEETN